MPIYFDRDNMLKKIEELEKQIKDMREELNTSKSVSNAFRRRILLDCMTAQSELDFIFWSYYGYGRSSGCSSDYAPIRKAAMLCLLNSEDEHSRYDLRKLIDLNDHQFQCVIDCADEITKVIAEKKREYLKSINRTDLIEAFEKTRIA